MVSANDKKVDGIDSVLVYRSPLHEKLGTCIQGGVRAVGLVDRRDRPNAIAWIRKHEAIALLTGSCEQHQRRGKPDPPSGPRDED